MVAAQGLVLKGARAPRLSGSSRSSNPCTEFNSLTERYLASADMSIATRQIYFRHFTRFSLLLVHRPWSSPLVLQEYLFSLAPVARVRAFSVFKRFFALLEAEGLCSNPCSVLTPPPNPTPCRHGLTAAELAAFNAALDQACADTHWSRKWSAIRLRLMVRLTLAFGVRPGQHLALTLSDLDIPGANLRIPPKTFRHSPRRVALSPLLLEELVSYSRWRSALPQTSERLWVNTFGQPLTHSALARQVEEFSERAGVRSFSGLHFLRHTVSRMLVEEGVSLFEVQRYLDHKRISYTDAYLRQNFPQAVYDASRVIESKLARLNGKADSCGTGDSGAVPDKPAAPELPRKGRPPRLGLMSGPLQKKGKP